MIDRVAELCADVVDWFSIYGEEKAKKRMVDFYKIDFDDSLPLWVFANNEFETNFTLEEIFSSLPSLEPRLNKRVEMLMIENKLAEISVKYPNNAEGMLRTQLEITDWLNSEDGIKEKESLKQSILLLLKKEISISDISRIIA